MTIRVVIPALADALVHLAPPGVAIGHRIISGGDEDALLPIETPTLSESVPRVRRQSGAARIVARQLLSTFGIHDAPLPRSQSGAPSWPTGFVGSLAHDVCIAVAAAASTERYVALGIDIEPAERLPPDLVDTVATPTERSQYPADLLESRLLFVIKEAVYKATNPLDNLFLDFHDITVDLRINQASIRNRRRIDFTVCTAPHIVALAYVKAS